MRLNTTKEHAALKRMTVGELRDRYADVHGEQTRSFHKGFLIRRILWRMQALQEGDLTERARNRAAEIANDADLRIRPPSNHLRLVGSDEGQTITQSLKAPNPECLPIPGSLMTRDYKGRRLTVRVLDRGFEFEGERYRSLSAVAKAITGTHWNGHLFFGLRTASERKRGGA